MNKYLKRLNKVTKYERQTTSPDVKRQLTAKLHNTTRSSNKTKQAQPAEISAQCSIYGICKIKSHILKIV